MASPVRNCPLEEVDPRNLSHPAPSLAKRVKSGPAIVSGGDGLWCGNASAAGLLVRARDRARPSLPHRAPPPALDRARPELARLAG